MQAEHVGIFGDSGSGKSTYLKELHDRFGGLSVYLNHDGESGVSGHVCRSYDGLRRASTTQINLQPSDPVDGAKMARQGAREYAQRTGYPAQVLVDEAADVMPDGCEHDNPVRQGLRKDRDGRVKWAVASQRPGDVEKRPLSNCRHFVWVGAPHSLHRGFLNYYGLREVDFPDGPHRYVTIRMKDPPEVVHRGETDPRFG